MILYHQIKSMKLEEKNIEEKEERQGLTRKMTADRSIRNRRKNAGK